MELNFPGSSNPAWLSQLAGLKLEGENLQREAEAAQREIIQLLSGGSVGAVAISFDDLGLIVKLAIDSELRKGLSAQQLVQEINLALLKAARPFVPDHASEPLQGVTAGRQGNPQETTNDFKTVVVVASLNVIASIRCDLRWIESSPDRLISEEIVRVARIAGQRTSEGLR